MVKRTNSTSRKKRLKNEFGLDYNSDKKADYFGSSLYGFTFNISIDKEAFDERLKEELRTEDIDYIEVKDEPKLLGDNDTKNLNQ